MSVDIRLCGNIPRKELQDHFTLPGAPCILSALTSQAATLSSSCLAGANVSDNRYPTHHTTTLCDDLRGFVAHNKSNMRSALQEAQPLSPLFEPPSWAVPARGETRLEPVCESLGRQYSVDLTKQASFRVGRSPNSDIQLMHATSSRRHAMLFHHSNGACYVVDCGSAHGTYVNGIRVSPPGKAGVVVPHKVRRGALIRFGGPGAPCFVLKSFSFSLRDILDDSVDKSDMGELIRRNTRINALGKSAGDVVMNNVMTTIDKALAVTRKRSFDILDSNDALFDENSFCKRRCMSPPLSPEAPIRIVSPDSQSVTSKRRHVTFSEDPPKLFYPSLVTPDELSSEEDDGSV